MTRWRKDQYEYELESDKLWKKSPNGKYWVSDYGDVISIYTGYRLDIKPCKRSGYHKIGVDTGYHSLHRLVFSTFVGEIPEGLQINHLDGNKSNNHLSNLEVCTASENVQHAYDAGLSKPMVGEKNSNSKVTEEDVLAMYQLFKLGYTNSMVGDIYDLHDRYISLVRHGRRWKYLWDREGMYKTPSLGHLKYNLPKCVYIYNMCMTSKLPQDKLAEVLDIDSSTVSRIRTGNTWMKFREFFGLPEKSYDWRENKTTVNLKEDQ